jgi:hypothetical protein
MDQVFTMEDRSILSSLSPDHIMRKLLYAGYCNVLEYEVLVPRSLVYLESILVSSLQASTIDDRKTVASFMVLYKTCATHERATTIFCGSKNHGLF